MSGTTAEEPRSSLKLSQYSQPPLSALSLVTHFPQRMRGAIRRQEAIVIRIFSHSNYQSLGSHCLKNCFPPADDFLFTFTPLTLFLCFSLTFPEAASHRVSFPFHNFTFTAYNIVDLFTLASLQLFLLPRNPLSFLTELEDTSVGF
jgi:hypothetical protein